MSTKKAQGMPVNVIIIAIIVLVVLVILIAFFAGGFGSITNKVRDLFTGQTSGQARDVVIQTCQNLCDTAKVLPTGSQKLSGYCHQSFLVANPGNPPERMICGHPGSGSIVVDPKLITQDTNQNPPIIESSSDLGINCPEVTC